jgi:glycosyltransferase involved in cell wall biosynthesis
MPKVSVVIPVYNREASIARAVRSALDQTVRDIEIIVVDDRSSDNTVEVLEQVTDTRIVMLRNEANAGAAAARNRGICAATGRFVAFLDSDDFWDPEKLERQLACFETAAADVHVICSAYRGMHIASGRVVERRPGSGTNWPLRLLDVCSIAPGSTMLARRQIFSEIGDQNIDLRQFEDWDWLLRYQKKYPLIVMQEVLATISMHGSPEPASVKQQAARLYELRKQAVAAQYGRRGLKRFHASMHIEYAVACIRAGQPLLGTGAVMRAAMLSPSRVYDLLKRAGTKILGRDY